jgi:hypothetical protein
MYDVGLVMEHALCLVPLAGESENLMALLVVELATDT